MNAPGHCGPLPRAPLAPGSTTRGGIEELTAADVMSPEVLAAGHRDTVLAAASLMQRGRVQHLPVLRGTEVVGVLEQATLAARLSGADWGQLQQPVARCMHRAVVRARPGTGLPELARLLLCSPSGVVVILDGARLCGVVTATDIVIAVAAAPTAGPGRRPEGASRLPHARDDGHRGSVFPPRAGEPAAARLDPATARPAG